VLKHTVIPRTFQVRGICTSAKIADSSPLKWLDWITTTARKVRVSFLDADQKLGRNLLQLLDQLEANIGELDEAVSKAARQDARVWLLRTHPGLGPVTALAFVLVVGDVTRFPRSKKLASYLGVIPSEDSSGTRRRLGAISKQGNTLLRTLLVE